ncbi:hypothetical protein ACFQH1_00595 [Lactiplantibacillus daoliensis]|uniref:Uncharacterized protein n=1 Tax=Lactiplantibacillus daoliensis TaxID=2559916 RepID=A0ABW1UC71_9LACO|nr:hypothetical protein [Lactiplantibacillus daoliensis]
MTQRQELIQLVDTAFVQVQLPQFETFRAQLGQFSMDLTHGAETTQVMIALRKALLQADLSLKLKNRIAGLPVEYRAIYDFIAPELKAVDTQTVDKYTHYGFVPLKFGSTVKYP